MASNWQVAADGAELAVRTRARLGRDTVHVSGPELPRWLRDSSHPAMS
jgi:hypothetical protein